MRKKFLLAILTLSLILSVFWLQGVHSQTIPSGFIFILPDGKIEPPTAPISRSGEVYMFTRNISSPIVLERGNIILEGAGYSLLGNVTGTSITVAHSPTGPDSYFSGMDNGVAVNVTCSNTTVQNIRIVNWVAGICGAYDNNTIKGNIITDCQSAIKIYGQNYQITQNTITNNSEGIRLSASRSVVKQNIVEGNKVGFEISYSDHTIFENNISNTQDIQGSWTGKVLFYRNNFLSGNGGSHMIFLDHPGASMAAAWDNGAEGNYWSDYTGKDADGNGVGDTAYKVKKVENFPGVPNMPLEAVWGQDNYPLMQPVTAPSYSLPMPTSTPPQATPTATAQPATPAPETTTTPQTPTPTTSANATNQTKENQTNPFLGLAYALAAVATILLALAVIMAMVRSRRFRKYS